MLTKTDAEVPEPALADYDPITPFKDDHALEILPQVVFDLVGLVLTSAARARGETADLFVSADAYADEYDDETDEDGEHVVRLTLGDISHEYRFDPGEWYEIYDTTKAVVAHHLLFRVINDLTNGRLASARPD